MQAASSASGLEAGSSPPPYSSITVEVPTTSGIALFNIKQLVMLFVFVFVFFASVILVIIKSVNGLLWFYGGLLAVSAACGSSWARD